MRVLASAAVALTLAACGGDDSEDAGAAAEQPASAVGGDSAVDARLISIIGDASTTVIAASLIAG